MRLQKSFDDGARAGSPLRDRRTSANTPSDNSRPNSASRSRPNSDSRRADVPHSIESGTDTEAEHEDEAAESQNSDASKSPPPPPPKEAKDGNNRRSPSEDDTVRRRLVNGDDLVPESPADGSDDWDDVDEGTVEATSTATFIAPALPPIRFSMSGTDFSDMLKNVGGGMPSLKSLENLAKLQEQESTPPPTPPPTAVLPATPSTDAAVAEGKFDPTPAHKTQSSANGTAGATKDEPANAPPTSFAFERLPLNVKRPHTADALDTKKPLSSAANGRPSTSSMTSATAHTITVTTPESTVARSLTPDGSELVVRRLQEAYTDATERGANDLKLDRNFVEALLLAFEQRKEAHTQLKTKMDTMRRASQQYVDGLSVAQSEYDQELKARRDAEAEVTRLRVLLSGQAARLTTVSGEVKRQTMRQQQTKDLGNNLDEMERNLSKLRVERDMTLAEVEELSATKATSDGDVPSASLGRSLTMRLDNIKKQYQHELVPLTQQREALAREIAEMKAARDMVLEETTVLNARNEELAQLTAHHARRLEMSGAPVAYKAEAQLPSFEKKSSSFDRSRSQPPTPAPNMQQSFSASSTGSAQQDDIGGTWKSHNSHKGTDVSSTPRPAKFKWPGTKAREPVSSVVVPDSKAPGPTAHSFQQLSVLRFTRCDHCGDKMWGSQLRCSGE